MIDDELYGASDNPTPPPVPDEPRTLTPVQTYWTGTPGVKNFSPHITPADAPTPREAKEVDEALTPVPKDEFAQVSVSSSASPTLDDLETPASLEAQTPTPESKEAADKANGKGNGSSEVVPPTQPTTSPVPASSSPSSSSPKKPGASVPPVQAQPPTSGPTPPQ